MCFELPRRDFLAKVIFQQFMHSFQLLIFFNILILQVIGPGGNSLYSGERESNGKFTLNADNDGVYKYCFGNKMSSMTPKMVMFSMEMGEKHQPLETKDGDGKLLLLWVKSILGFFLL